MNKKKSLKSRSAVIRGSECWQFKVWLIRALFASIVIFGHKAFAEKPVSNRATDQPISLHSSESFNSSESIQVVAQGGEAGLSPEKSNTSNIQNTVPAPLGDQATRPHLDLDPSLRNDLKTQFMLIRTLLETEDAFSTKLGEHYLSYGFLLKRAGRLDEAKEKFKEALHIEKINNGVYSIEQRNILSALFDINLLTGKTAELENNLRRMVWLDAKFSGEKDDFNYEYLIKAGHHFIDRYLQQPIASEQSSKYLQTAISYFKYAIKRFDGKLLSERILPYGEIAYANHLLGEVLVKINYQAGFNQSPFNNSPRRRLDNPSAYSTPDYLSQSFVSGQSYLKQHLRKAQAEGSIEQVVTALVGLGDLSLLFRRKPSASNYYQLAWLSSQALPKDHPIVKSFDHPVALPEFQYAYAGRVIDKSKYELNVPLNINVKRDGRVGTVSALRDEDSGSRDYYRARRAVKRVIFRPAFERGTMVDTKMHEHSVGLLSR